MVAITANRRRSIALTAMAAMACTWFPAANVCWGGERVSLIASNIVQVATESQLLGWVADLDHKEYARREEAAANLRRFDVLSIPYLVHGAGEHSIERTMRCVRLLGQIYIWSEDPETSRRAEEALRHLAESQHLTASPRAQFVLSRQQPWAHSMLFLWGARIRFENATVDIRDNWQGEDQGLLQLRFITDLREIRLDGAPITDRGLNCLRWLRNVKTLAILQVPISDNGLSQLKNVADTLETLHLSDTKITDAGMTHLAGLRKLRYLDLSGTEVTLDGLRQISSLSELRDIDLRRTAVRDVDREEVSKMLPHLRGVMLDE